MDWDFLGPDQGKALSYATSPNGALILWEPGTDRTRALAAFGQHGLLRRLRWKTREERLSVNPTWIDSITRQLRASAQLDEIRLGPWFVGEDTPYQKGMAAVTDASSAVVAFVKFALSRHAEARIRRSGDALASLSENDAGELGPRLLDEIDAPIGRALVLEAVSGRPGPNRPGPRHWSWLETQSSRLRSSDSEVEASLKALENRADRVGERVIGHPEPYLEAVEEVLRRSLDSRLPFSMAHGDFVPWNIRAAQDRIVVVDWEGSLPAAPPAYDLFYHEMMTSRRRLRISRHPWDARVVNYLESQRPELLPHYPSMRTAFLVYALDAFADVTDLDPQPGPTWRWLSATLAAAIDA